MGTEQPSPSGKGKSAKRTVNLLPQLSQARSKPLWQQTCPLFHLSKEQKDDKSDEFTIKNEYSPGDYLKVRCKRHKIQDSRDNEAGAGPSTSTLQSSSHLKKKHESFRSALVNIILQQDLTEEHLPSLDGTHPPRPDSSTPIEKDILVAKDCF